MLQRVHGVSDAQLPLLDVILHAHCHDDLHLVLLQSSDDLLYLFLAVQMIRRAHGRDVHICCGYLLAQRRPHAISRLTMSALRFANLSVVLESTVSR